MQEIIAVIIIITIVLLPVFAIHTILLTIIEGIIGKKLNDIMKTVIEVVTIYLCAVYYYLNILPAKRILESDKELNIMLDKIHNRYKEEDNKPESRKGLLKYLLDVWILKKPANY